MENNRNLFITIALSVLILALWQVFYVIPRNEAQREAARIETGNAPQQQTSPGAGVPRSPTASGTVPGQVPGTDNAAPVSRDSALAKTRRIRIDTPRLAGSINLVGARLDDISLKDYHLTIDKSSPIIELLNPGTLVNGQFVEIGFIEDNAVGEVPGSETKWTVEGDPVLSPGNPVTLTFVNDKGLTFKRIVSVDANYMFTVSDTVTNSSDAPVALSNYGRVTRFGKPEHASIYVLHEGLIGVVGGNTLKQERYSAIEKEGVVKLDKTSDGWLGITDKYWAAALVPSNKQKFQPTFTYFKDETPSYQADFRTDPFEIAAGQSATIETQVFAGAKEVATVGAYAEKHNIPLFEKLIDWGVLYLITQPMFQLIDWLYKLLGNFGLAILATTVLVKIVFFPLANKSYKSMANMKKVQPALLEIREKYADDKMKQQQAMMELYKTEKINPLAGCWPVLIQFPVFFALYKVLYITIEMRHAPFFGWIQDLAAPDPTSLFNLFGLLPFAVPDFLHIGVWPLIMGITMFLQMRMNPTPPDPTQAMIFNWMPVIFTFMLASFPAGLVIYWAWNNFLSILQQGAIMKSQGAKIELWDNLAGLIRKKPKPTDG